MNVFSHSGRFGDLFYALWTMRELGGGKLVVSDFHTPGWSLDMARTLESFLLYQPYIQEVEFRPYLDRGGIDYDLQEAEGDFNPEAFPECPDVPEMWPGNINIAKRYAVHFGLTYRPGEKWLEAADIDHPPAIIMHVPARRRLRGNSDWAQILSTLGVQVKVGVFGMEYSGDWMETARRIDSASLFLGVVSGPHALAEGLGKTRFVEQAPGCFNVSVLPPSQCINGWPNEKVIEEVRKLL